MKKYEFTLIFNLKDTATDPESYVDKLYAAGCNDAIVGIGHKGRIALNFTRKSSSINEAIDSALSDVKNAIPDAILVETNPTSSL